MLGKKHLKRREEAIRKRRGSVYRQHAPVSLGGGVLDATSDVEGFHLL